MTTHSRLPGRWLGLFAACGCVIALTACSSSYKPVPGVDVTRIVWGRNFPVPTVIPPKEINEVCRRAGPLTTCDYNYSSRDWAHRYPDPGKGMPPQRKDVSVAYNCGSGTVGVVAYFNQVEDVPFHFDCSAPEAPRAWCGPTLDADPLENCLKGPPAVAPRRQP